MNASAYLKGFGWRGEGFPLDTTDRGIAKPLLVQHKIDLTGLGTKKNDFSNQWWLSSFDDCLKTIGDTKATQPTPTPFVFKQTGLYSSFVRAETLQSTIESGVFGKVAEEELFDKSANHASMSMSTLPAGFVLGETSATSSSTQPIITTREKRGKKRKHNEDGSALDMQPLTTVAVEPPIKVKKEKKDKKERKEMLLNAPASESSTAEAAAKPKKEKRNKRKEQTMDEPNTTTTLRTPDPSAGPKTSKNLRKKEKESKHEKSDGVVYGSATIGSMQIEDKNSKISSIGRTLETATASKSLMQEDLDAAPGFISFVDSSDLPKSKKVKKPKVASDFQALKPNVLDISSAMALGMPDTKGIPTVHPKTGQPLSKKARKTIAKKQSKIAMKNGRAEVRARRQAKKTERAKQAAAKKKASEEKPLQQKEKKGEKYARQKALRVARREAKAQFSSGKGTGANSMPVG